MRTTRTFSKLVQAWAAHPRYIDSGGGARSGKTYAFLQLLSLVIPNDKTKTITSVVSETGPHLSRGAIRDFKTIMAEDGRWDDNAWNSSHSIYTFPNGAILEFFSADQPGKVHGPARDRLFLNEANNIPFEVARQLIIRTRDIVAWDYNPTRVFWAHEHYQGRDNCITIHSTYKDNQFLSREQVVEIESYKGDNNWWRVYGLGLLGSLEGVIYDFDLIDEMPPADGLREIYGLDFGFTHDPTAIVRLLADTRKKAVYCDEITYKTGMLNEDIKAALRAQNIPKTTKIWADAAEPKSIAEIGAGTSLNIRPCDKGAPTKSSRLTFQLQWMQGWRMYITKRSTNVIKEARNYTWDRDKDGNLVNTPIDAWNHAMDAIRYGLYSEFAGHEGKGQYNISVKRY